MNQLLMEFELARLGISGQLWSSDSETIGLLMRWWSLGISQWGFVGPSEPTPITEICPSQKM